MNDIPTESVESVELDEIRKGLVDRLKRIEGQVRGIQRMIHEGRDCNEILPQLSAVLSATKRVASLLAYCSLTERVHDAVTSGKNPRDAVKDLVDLLSRLP